MGMIAQKRAFSSSIVESDAFLELSQGAQLLYFHLNMCSDNDGVVDTPRTVMRNTRAHDGDMRALIGEGLVIVTNDGKLVIIKDWNLHNNIRFGPRRYQHGRYYDIAQMLLQERAGSTPGALPDKTTNNETNFIKQQQQNDVADVFSENEQEIFRRLTGEPWQITAKRARALITTHAVERCAAFELWARKKHKRGEDIGAGLLITMISDPDEPTPLIEQRELAENKRMQDAQNATKKAMEKAQSVAAEEPITDPFFAAKAAELKERSRAEGSEEEG